MIVYLYHLELHQGRKESTELKLGASVKTKLCEPGKMPIVIFAQFFDSPLLIQKLRKDRLYHLGQLNMIINMPEMRQEKEMSRGSFQYKF